MIKNKKQIGLILGGFVMVAIILGNVIFKESPTDYLNRVDSSIGTYVQEKSFGDFKVKMKYKAPTYMATAQLLRSTNSEKTDFKDLVKEYETSSNYVLQFENMAGGDLIKKIASSNQKYQELVNYLAFGIHEDLFLCTTTDTIPCSFAHFERNFDVAPFTNIDVGFKYDYHSLLDQDNWSILFNAERFAIGPLYFRFEAEELNENPKFSFDK